jgi:hypothetical protein
MAINLLRGKKQSLEGNITSVCAGSISENGDNRILRNVVISVQNRTASQTATTKFWASWQFLNRTDEPFFSLQVTSRSDKYAKNGDKT